MTTTCPWDVVAGLIFEIQLRVMRRMDDCFRPNRKERSWAEAVVIHSWRISLGMHSSDISSFDDVEVSSERAFHQGQVVGTFLLTVEFEIIFRCSSSLSGA